MKFLPIFCFLFTIHESLAVTRHRYTQRRVHYDHLNYYEVINLQDGPDSQEAIDYDTRGSQETLRDRWFDQCMDHFDPDDPPPCKNTWKQRYWWSDHNVDFSNPPNSPHPIFYFLGGETPVKGFTSPWNMWQKYAKKYKAYTLTVEHRYYGYSYPTEPKDRSNATMSRYLTSRQALADYVNLIRAMKKARRITDSKVVTFGGSYPGSLSAWMRQEYPMDINVAVSHSAPLQWQVEFPEFINTCGKAIKEMNPQCFTKIQSAFDCMESLFNGNPCHQTKVTLDTLAFTMGSCNDEAASFDAGERFTFLVSIGLYTWMNDNPATSNKGNCEILVAQNTSDILLDYANFLDAVNLKKPCRPARRRQRFRPKYTRRSETSDPGSKYNYERSWAWQVCNEFGDMFVSDPVDHMLGRNLNTFETDFECQSQFPDSTWTRERLEKNVAKTNADYKGKMYNGTCAIFTNGLWDPWYTQGIYDASQTSSANTVIPIAKAEHCEVMEPVYPTRAKNPWAAQDVIAAQNQIKKQIGIYLASPDC